MNGTRILPVRALTAAALVVAAIGIGIQILAGADYPPVPPGAVILAVAAGACVLVRRWWAPVIAVVVALFLLVGAVVTPNATDQLSEPVGSGLFLGTFVQLMAVAVALVAGILATVGERRAHRAP